LNNTRDATRGARGRNSPGVESLRGPKSHNNVISTCFKTVHLFPKRPQVRTWGRQTSFSSQAPSNLVTPLRTTIV